MANTRKIISLLLSLLMILSLFAAVSFGALAEELYSEIKLGETVTVTIENGGDIAYLKYVPDEDMTVIFSASSEDDTYGYLYDAEMSELAGDDDGGSGRNFKITYDVTAGQTYYFGAKYYDESYTGSFDVSLEEKEDPVYPEIKVGDTLTVTIEDVGEIAYLKFVPDEDMTVVFSAPSSNDTYGFLYNAQMNLLAVDFGNARERYFKITYDVTAGQTYYFGARYLDNTPGSFDVSLEEKEDPVYPEIKVGDTVTVSIENGGDVAYLKFVPDTNMTVVFSASADADIDGNLYDAEMERLAFNDGGIGYNFKITYDVTAGETYYFGAGYCDNITGEFTVSLKANRSTWNYQRDYNTYDDIIITGYYGSDTDVIIPSQIDGKTVTAVGSEAFRDRTDITSVTIPDSVTSIGYSAFEGCTALTTISIPDSVEEIEIGAFSDTAWYENQPDGLVYAGKVAYRMKGDCPANVVIADGTVSITEQAFYECTGMTELVLPDSLKSIGSGAFEYCGGLTSVVIPDGITEIQMYTFNNCTGLTSVTIPDSVWKIGVSAFQGCTSLKSITIPEYTEIRDEAIGYYWDESGNEQLKMDDLTIYGYADTDAERYAEENGFTFVALEKPEFEYTIKNGEATIKKYNGTADELIIPASFEGCPVTKIDDDAFIDSVFTTVEIPESIAEIGYSAFSYCYNLKSVVIPGSVTKISDAAFYGCSDLTSVTLNEGLKEIGIGVFATCPDLKSVTIPKSVDEIGTSAFGNVYGQNIDGFTIYGYKGTAAETYANDNGFTFVALDAATGFTVSGTVTSFLDDEGEVTLTLYNDAFSKTVTVNGNSASYSFADVPEGVYSLSAAKANHVTRVYEFEVIDDTELDAKIHPIGDISGDGAITNMDFARANSHVRGVVLLNDYEQKCADVVKNDGEITNMDAGRINSAARGISALW